jgi:DNA-directed RNA polymerase subunit K/omega
MSDVENEIDQPESVELPQAQPIESRFLYVDVAALRAKQLRRGAKSRLEPAEPEDAQPASTPAAAAPPAVPVRKIKAERVAMQEVRSGLVEWALPDFKAVFDIR